MPDLSRPETGIPSPKAADPQARLRLLYELACAFAARIELDELIPFVIEKVRDVIGADGASVLLLDPERQELYFPYITVKDPEAAARLARLRFPAGKGIAGDVVRNGRSRRVDDVASDPSFSGEIDRQTGFTTRNLICAPLATGEDTIGVLQVLNRRGGESFTEEDLAFLEMLAGSISVAIANARRYAEVKTSEERLRVQVGVLRRDLARHDRFNDIIGTGPGMAEVFRLMESGAASPINVLIEGETGTGKEMVARGVHRASARAEGAFIAVNCAALPESLLESELFGHRRGAFTGALQDRRGLFEAASGGTIFLDEVGEMPAVMQAKLLRVLQEGEIVPVGDNRPRKVDVRVISATNRDLANEVKRGAFREDLYYRIAAFPIHLPPLRERSEDIALIADRMLKVAAKRHGKAIAGIDPEAQDAFSRSSWPGNVRQLQNEIERAVALAPEGAMISRAHLSIRMLALPTVSTVAEPASSGASVRPDGSPRAEGRAADPLDVAAQAAQSTAREPGAGQGKRSLRNARATFESRYLAEVLREHGGNVTRAAQALGVSRVMLQKKMKEYSLR